MRHFTMQNVLFLMSIPSLCRRPLFTEKRMAARQVVNAAACGKCPFPRAGAAAGRAWVQWTQHTCRRVEPLGRRGLQDRPGWGSIAGTAPARFRPPPQPSPCPGAGARSLVAGILGVRRSFTMWNVLFLLSGPAAHATGDMSHFGNLCAWRPYHLQLLRQEPRTICQVPQGPDRPCAAIVTTLHRGCR